jgi:uncharacterized protein
MMELPTSVVTRLVQFCRFARDRGYPAAINETVNALQIASALGISDRGSLKAGLRAVICSSKEEWDRFDEVFEDFWMADTRPTQSIPVPSRKREREEEKTGRFQDVLSSMGESRNYESDDGQITQGAAAVERLKKVDFSEVPRGDVEDLERISLRLIRHMSLRLSRRLRAVTRSGHVDLRRTIRRSIGRGGEPFEISFKNKQLQRSRLVILLDISGSMNTYSIFLLKFAWVLQKHFPQVKTFVFSTRLEDITSIIRARGMATLLETLSDKAAGWSGGTKIGESLREFNLLYARRILTRDSVCIVLSDGWDTGDPEALAYELAAIKRRVRKLIWLNPLLGMSDYQPVTRGMSAALPWIDVFAPAHNLESLLELETHLRRN